MSDVKHTPGPWQAFRIPGIVEQWSVRQEPTETGRWHIIDGATRGVGTDVSKVNARLIAASPDLLSAAKDAIAYDRDGYCPRCGSHSEDLCDVACVALRAAIAKAEGTV